MDSSTSGERIQDVDEVQLVVELLVGGGVGLEQGGEVTAVPVAGSVARRWHQPRLSSLPSSGTCRAAISPWLWVGWDLCPRGQGSHCRGAGAPS